MATPTVFMTTHRKFIGEGPTSGLVQLEATESNASFLISLPEFGQELCISSGPLKGFTALRSDLGVHFKKDGFYLCAEPSNDALICNRVAAGAWETFAPVTQEELLNVARLYNSPNEELARFRSRVAQLVARNEPVKIYCGCGDIPRDGFLNIDIVMMAPTFSVRNYSNYFIFPFADIEWSIPDNTVDYIFHEDFVEHVDQLQQIQFLAEALRVLKPGAWHRVNTPNLIASMKQNSDFAKGIRGVYAGEKEQWGHIALLTPDYLKEIAFMIGYREVVFTTKSHGVSPFAEADIRPLSDRDGVFGNIYADLLK